MSLADQQWCPTSVQVTVLQARGLRIKGKSGTNDAYALMQLGKEKYQTSVVEKSIAPVWKEEATFDLPPQLQGGGGGAERSTLRVHVLHRALVGPDKLLGQAVINLLQLSEDKTRNKTEWFKLLDKTGKPDKDRGEVFVDIQFMRNNMTASMFDLSAAGKSRSRLSKFKDKVRGKKKESDSASSMVPSFTQVLTDSEEDEANGEEVGEASRDGKSKKHKMKSLFSPKSNLQRNMSQSMSVLPAKNSSLSRSQSSGLNVDLSEGKKKFKFMIHKRSGSSDSKDSSSGHQKQFPVEQSNLCINGSHIYCEEPPPRTSRTGSNYSLASSGRGSMEDVPENSPPSVDSLRAARQYSPWMEEEEEQEETAENIQENVDESKRAEEERIKMEERKRVEEETVRRQKELESLAEEKLRQEEERKKLEEKVRREEEKRKGEEEDRIWRENEKRRQEEEERAEQRRQEENKLAEEKKLKEEEGRKIEEEKARCEEEQKRKEEERAEEERSQKAAEEMTRKLEELKRLREEEERLKQEEVKRQEEERARKDKEEYERLMEEKRKLEEEKKQIEAEEKLRNEEEEKMRMEEEMKRKEDEERRARREEELEEKRRLEEQERKTVELEKMQREEEERIRKERLEQEEETLRRQQEELEKVAKEKLRQEEEERRKVEEEKVRREEEQRIRKERLEQEEETLRRQQEELEKLAKEKLRQEEEERRKVEEEKVRREEVEKIKREEEERIREEEMRQKEQDMIRRQEEEQERLSKEILRQKEEKNKLEEMVKREEEERIRRKKEKRQREEEKVRKEKETSERLAMETKRLQEQEKRRTEEEAKKEEEERIRREERKEQEAKKLEKEILTREVEECEKKESGTNGGRAAGNTSKVSSPTDITSTNPFDEDFSYNASVEIPSSSSGPHSHKAKEESVQERCQSSVSVVGSRAISGNEKDPVGSQREKRPAPQPPGKNQAERQRQDQQDVSEIKQTKDKTDKTVKTVSVLPQRSVQIITPLSKSPTDSENTQSVRQDTGTKVTSARHSKRLAPSRPHSVGEPSSESKTTLSHKGVSETKESACSLNPFEDDEDENELTAQDDTVVSGPVHWPPIMSQNADKDASSQVKVKSLKMARAPQPPAKNDTTSSNLINHNNDGGHITGTANGAGSGGNVQESPNQELQQTKVKNVAVAGVKEEGPPSSRRLQPVKPLSPPEQKSASVVRVENNKSPGILSGDEVKKKVDCGLAGPYSQLTQEELISLVLKQESQLSERDKKISELEQYIDNLLVRVMEEKPSILMSLTSLKKAI